MELKQQGQIALGRVPSVHEVLLTVEFSIGDGRPNITSSPACTEVKPVS